MPSLPHMRLLEPCACHCVRHNQLPLHLCPTAGLQVRVRRLQALISSHRKGRSQHLILRPLQSLSSGGLPSLQHTEQEDNYNCINHTVMSLKIFAPPLRPWGLLDQPTLIRRHQAYCRKAPYAVSATTWLMLQPGASLLFGRRLQLFIEALLYLRQTQALTAVTPALLTCVHSFSKSIQLCWEAGQLVCAKNFTVLNLPLYDSKVNQL